MFTRLGIVVVFGLGIALTPVGSAVADTTQSDSLALYGLWNWVSSSGGLLGARLTPSLCGYSRAIQFRRDGTYAFTESDSANRYLIAGGRFDLYRDRDGAWLDLENWDEVGLKYERVTFQGSDTMSLYPGGGGYWVSDALTHRYVRLGSSAEAADSRAPRPWVDRPPRIFVGLGGRHTYVERGKLSAVDWNPRNFFIQASDHSYPVSVLSNYLYTHFQSPSAIIGDFDSNDTLDVAIYGHDDSLSQVRVYFSATNPPPPLVLTSEPVVVGTLPGFDGDRRARGKIPLCFLEIVHAGETIHLADGRDLKALHDGIRVVRIGGPEIVYAWESDRFAPIAVAKRR